jgi:hypothetical protein
MDPSLGGEVITAPAVWHSRAMFPPPECFPGASPPAGQKRWLPQVEVHHQPVHSVQYKRRCAAHRHELGNVTAGEEFSPCVDIGSDNNRGMRMIILLALGMWAVPAAWAEQKFQIGPISKGKTAAGTERVNGVFPPPQPTIEFSVTLAEDMPMNELVATIYFFDAQNRLVLQRGAGLDFDRMNYDKYVNRTRERMKREKKNVMEIEIPSTAQAGKKYYFRHMVGRNDPPWSHLVVVAGRKNGDLIGRVYPKADHKNLNFPEKAKVTFWFES